MKRPLHFVTAGCAAGILGLLAPGPLAAQQDIPGLAAPFKARGAYSNFTLTVVGAKGFHARLFSRRSVPSIEKLGKLPDGEYAYQITAATKRVDKTGDELDNGRGNKAPAPRVPAEATGSFLVVDGRLIVPSGKIDDDDAD